MFLFTMATALTPHNHSFFLRVVFFFLAGVALALPGVSSDLANEIMPCSGGSSGPTTVVLDQSIGALSSLNPEDIKCMANRVQGLSSISSFTYYALHDSGSGAITASGRVLDASAGYAVVASVDLTAQLPSTATSTAVTATFASAVALDPSHVYLLAICAGGTGSNAYTVEFNQDVVNSMRYCYDPVDACTSDGAWGDVSIYNLKTSIDGSCPSPSTSPLTCCVGPQRCA
jgi:hypothetical protein